MPPFVRSCFMWAVILWSISHRKSCESVLLKRPSIFQRDCVPAHPCPGSAHAPWESPVRGSKRDSFIGRRRSQLFRHLAGIACCLALSLSPLPSLLFLHSITSTFLPLVAPERSCNNSLFTPAPAESGSAQWGGGAEEFLFSAHKSPPLPTFLLHPLHLPLSLSLSTGCGTHSMVPFRGEGRLCCAFCLRRNSFFVSHG